MSYKHVEAQRQDASAKQVVAMSEVGKCYRLYKQPSDRLRQFFTRTPLFSEVWALQPASLEIRAGEVLGIVGRNGAGKSTLLQLLAGTLPPSTGTLTTRGKVAALLELGAGFNPDFTGRENVFISASLMGLSLRQTQEKLDEIIAFSGLEARYIDQPVKTYSSGMFVRLAFAVATSVEPDILIIDEALSVGDGAFARKSFDRIMRFKDQGKTILFCSHATYQIEAICSRAIWLEKGRIIANESPQEVVRQYLSFLSQTEQSAARETTIVSHSPQEAAPSVVTPVAPPSGIPKIVSARFSSSSKEEAIASLKDDLIIEVTVALSGSLAAPSLGVLICDEQQRHIASAGTHNDHITVPESHKQVVIKLCWPKLPLLKGHYSIDLFLLCEKGIHLYEHVRQAYQFCVTQESLELGVVNMPHNWSVTPL